MAANQGAYVASQGGGDDALTAYGRATALEPGLALAHEGIGDCYLRLYRPREALAEYEAGLRLQPDSLSLRQKVGQLRQELGP